MKANGDGNEMDEDGEGLKINIERLNILYQNEVVVERKSKCSGKWPLRPPVISQEGVSL